MTGVFVEDGRVEDFVLACTCGKGSHQQKAFRRISKIHFESVCPECGMRCVAPAEIILNKLRPMAWLNGEAIQL